MALCVLMFFALTAVLVWYVFDTCERCYITFHDVGALFWVPVVPAISSVFWILFWILGFLITGCVAFLVVVFASAFERHYRISYS